VTDDIRALTAQLAAEPESLAFLPLGEALRQRRQLDAALIVAEGGVRRYPALADAHDLVARIRSDRGEGDLAFDAWTEALRHAPAHVGALRGLAYLAFRAGDLARAARHLAAAQAAAPEDPAIRSALERVRAGVREAAPAPAPESIPFGSDSGGSLLVDGQGRRLAGLLLTSRGADVSDAVAAELAGVAREADRTARLLDLGDWRALAIECEEGNLHLVAPTADTLLLATGDVDTPAGRLALVAERAAVAARRWLERLS
jgi:predicted regulator of Ras-like GTPase activity (Roadblock/LC7/MglB family)